MNEDQAAVEYGKEEARLDYAHYMEVLVEEGKEAADDQLARQKAHMMNQLDAIEYAAYLDHLRALIEGRAC